MHLLTTTATSLDDIVEAVDLGQPPGEIAILSFADSDLTGLAAAWNAERAVLPSVRLAHLRDLRHPMSVDVWIERVGEHAKIIVVRLLGGLDWWKYGIERLSALARQRGIALAVLPGEDRDDALDPHIDRHRMAEIAQMCESGARQDGAFGVPGCGQPGEIAVGERQDRDLARRLAEIDRFDDVVE